MDECLAARSAKVCKAWCIAHSSFCGAFLEVKGSCGPQIPDDFLEI